MTKTKTVCTHLPRGTVCFVFIKLHLWFLLGKEERNDMHTLIRNLCVMTQLCGFCYKPQMHNMAAFSELSLAVHWQGMLSRG